MKCNKRPGYRPFKRMSTEACQTRASDSSLRSQHFHQTPHISVTQKPEDLVFEIRTSFSDNFYK